MLSQSAAYERLNQILQEVQDLRSASAVLNWDLSTYMPPNGAAMRGRQISTLGKIAHEKFTSKEVKDLLNSLHGYEENFSADSNEASLLRYAQKEFQKATRLPSHFVTQYLEHQAVCYDVWTKARAENNFKMILPYLEKTLKISKEYSNYFEHEHIADPLISESDEGFTAKQVQEVFQNLRKELVPLFEKIRNKWNVDDSCLKKQYPKDEQEKFNHLILEKFGFDFNRGRLDTTHHPFMTTFSHGDIRVTTRYKENDLSESLFSTIHEMGHAFYEMGVEESLDGNILFGGTSSGVHESQSRLWENIVGRGKSFWTYFYPYLTKAFPNQLKNVSLDAFYKAVNKVTPGLIRTDADEVTYNLHVMIRFDLELAMLQGDLSIADLPAAWNQRYKQDLGVDVPNDANGCLQDVHWFCSFIGGQFQGYTLGNIMSAQFYQAAKNSLPNLEQKIEAGEFVSLRKWLEENLHQFGKKRSGLEALKKATGENLNIKPYLNYLSEKYK